MNCSDASPVLVGIAALAAGLWVGFAVGFIMAAALTSGRRRCGTAHGGPPADDESPDHTVALGHGEAPADGAVRPGVRGPTRGGPRHHPPAFASADARSAAAGRCRQRSPQGSQR